MSLPPGHRPSSAATASAGIDRRPHVDLVHGSGCGSSSRAPSRAHDGLVRPDLSERPPLSRPATAAVRRRLDEATLRRGQQAVRVEDLRVSDGTMWPSDSSAGGDRRAPVRRISMRIAVAIVSGYGTGSPCTSGADPCACHRACDGRPGDLLLVLEVALPVGADVQGVPTECSARRARLPARRSLRRRRSSGLRSVGSDGVHDRTGGSRELADTSSALASTAGRPTCFSPGPGRTPCAMGDGPAPARSASRRRRGHRTPRLRAGAQMTHSRVVHAEINSSRSS